MPTDSSAGLRRCAIQEADADADSAPMPQRGPTPQPRCRPDKNRSFWSLPHSCDTPPSRARPSPARRRWAHSRGIAGMRPACRFCAHSCLHPGDPAPARPTTDTDVPMLSAEEYASALSALFADASGTPLLTSFTLHPHASISETGTLPDDTTPPPVLREHPRIPIRRRAPARDGQGLCYRTLSPSGGTRELTSLRTSFHAHAGPIAGSSTPSTPLHRAPDPWFLRARTSELPLFPR